MFLVLERGVLRFGKLEAHVAQGHWYEVIVRLQAMGISPNNTFSKPLMADVKMRDSSRARRSVSESLLRKFTSGWIMNAFQRKPRSKLSSATVAEDEGLHCQRMRLRPVENLTCLAPFWSGQSRRCSRKYHHSAISSRPDMDVRPEADQVSVRSHLPLDHRSSSD